MVTVVVVSTWLCVLLQNSCMCMKITTIEGTGIKQIQPKSGLLPEAIFTGC